MIRDDDLARLKACLETHSLVTVTGAPGVGKSHLVRSLGLATALVIDLGDVRSADAFWDRLAFAFHVTESDDRVDAVSRAASGRELLVLDDVDTVPPSALAAFLTRRVDTTVVLTSRRRTRIPGELLFELDSLPPEAAVRLFDELAMSVRGHALREHERTDTQLLVRELDGLPAALELAASRLRVLGVRALVHRLRTPLELLRDPSGDGRHQSLEAIVAWSWASLAETNQQALSQLTTFAGAFDGDAAEAVLNLEGSALDALVELRDRSLVVASTDQRETRLRVPHAVRAYVAGRLPAPDGARIRLAEHLAERLSDQTLPWLHADVAALLGHVAGTRVVSPALATAAVRLAVAATPLLLHRGPYDSFARVLGSVLDVTARSGAPAHLQARAFVARGRIRAKLGEPAAEADIRAGLSVALKLEERTLVDEALVTLAELVISRGDEPTLPDERPEGELGVRWDLARATLGPDREEHARRAAESGAAFLASRAHAMIAVLQEDARPHWCAAAELAERDGDEAMRARALLELSRLEPVPPERLHPAAVWAEQTGNTELANALRSASSTAGEHPLVVGADTFTIGQTTVSLSRRHALRRILRELAERRVDDGAAADWIALLEVGWPGEKVRAESGAHRVRVAISTLRKLGLGALLQTVEDGYVLDPDHPVRVE